MKIYMKSTTVRLSNLMFDELQDISTKTQQHSSQIIRNCVAEFIKAYKTNVIHNQAQA